MQRSVSKLTSQPLALPLSRSQSRIKVRAGDKWLIAGMTGCGKTTFAKELCLHLEKLYPTARIYILDYKNWGDFDDYPGRVLTVEAPPKPQGNQRYQVWVPVGKRRDEIEKWLSGILNDAPAILFIDELVGLSYSQSNFSEEYTKISQLGRAAPVGIISLTQKLSKVPEGTIGQATHIVRFRLRKKYDQIVSRDLLNEDVGEPPDEFGFYYQKATSNGPPKYFSSYELFF